MSVIYSCQQGHDTECARSRKSPELDPRALAAARGKVKPEIEPTNTKAGSESAYFYNLRARYQDLCRCHSCDSLARSCPFVLLMTFAGGLYIPPARLRMMQAQIQDKTSVEYQSEISGSLGASRFMQKFILMI